MIIRFNWRTSRQQERRRRRRRRPGKCIYCLVLNENRTKYKALIKKSVLTRITRPTDLFNKYTDINSGFLFHLLQLELYCRVCLHRWRQLSSISILQPVFNLKLMKRKTVKRLYSLGQYAVDDRIMRSICITTRIYLSRFSFALLNVSIGVLLLCTTNFRTLSSGWIANDIEIDEKFGCGS